MGIVRRENFMNRLVELLGNLGLTIKDAGEITGFIMAILVTSVIFGNIISECMISFCDFLGELLCLLLRWILKHIKRLRSR